jgi:hypothetical protein
MQKLFKLGIIVNFEGAKNVGMKVVLVERRHVKEQLRSSHTEILVLQMTLAAS